MAEIALNQSKINERGNPILVEDSNQIKLLKSLNWETGLVWVHLAYATIPRVEPLIVLAEYYAAKRMWPSCFLYAKAACDLKEPVDNILFVNRDHYDYKRWHWLSVAAYYVGEHELGKKTAEMLVEKFGRQVDIETLKFYKNS
jgi:hypothetical protein